MDTKRRGFLRKIAESAGYGAAAYAGLKINHELLDSIQVESEKNGASVPVTQKFRDDEQTQAAIVVAGLVLVAKL